MKANENNFIDLLKKRKEEGILYVIDTYGGFLRSIVRRHLSGTPDRVEECMNDIFFGIWNNIDSFDEKRGTFVNWAAGVARLQAIDTLRRILREQRIRIVPLEDAEIAQEDRALEELSESEFSREAYGILNCLNERDRELFKRIFLAEEKPEKAGEALGLSRNSVYVRLFRGKQKIREKRGGGEHGNEQGSL